MQNNKLFPFKQTKKKKEQLHARHFEARSFVSKIVAALLQPGSDSTTNSTTRSCYKNIVIITFVSLKKYILNFFFLLVWFVYMFGVKRPLPKTKKARLHN